MHGIDISSYQSDIELSALPIDFCIFKATEGIGYVDSTFDKFSSDCLKLDIPFGFYHFARENSPEVEASFFYITCADLLGYGLPVLDYETTNANNVEWVEKFASEFHKLAGVYPVLYMSASMCAQFVGSWIVDVCPLWVAGYPATHVYYNFENVPEFPYSIYPWNSCIMWQFTSNMYLSAYPGRLDANISYISKEQWFALVGGEIMTDETIQRIAAACASYVWDGSQYDKDNGLNMYNCAHWTYAQVLELKALVMGLSETVKVLAQSSGADSDKIMKAVTDAVSKRLESLKIEVR